MRAVVAVLLFVTAAHAALWGLFQEKQQAPDFHGILPSVSYAPFEPGHTVVDGIADTEKIRADLKKLSTMARAVRLYSSTEGNELVPSVAAEFGLKVTVGAWIDKNADRNEREINAAIGLARHNSNVIGVVVGNETIYRGDQKVEDLIELIKRVKKSVNVPVTTGEIWNIWRDYPELAYSVDFIAAHVLPYWENFTDKQAVDQAVAMFQLLRDQFPGKRIVIAEFGWPSAGYNLRNAVPGPFEQASVLRNFVTRAEAIGMDYNIVEAIDQPWKFFEGGVGPYWGILNAAREPKFNWSGPIVNPDYWKLATIAVLVGILMSLPILRLAQPTVLQALMLSAAANGVGAWAATVFAYWDGHYFVFGSAFALDARPDPAGAAGADRDGADRGDRRHCLRPEAAPADRQGRRRSPPTHRPRSSPSQGLDPYPGLFRAAGDAESRRSMRSRGSTIRTSNASSSSTTRRIRRSGNRSRITAARSANASSSSTPRRFRASRPARCASPWSAPPPTPRSSASSMPTTWSSRTG